MCYNRILPTTAKSENANANLLELTRIFNRWLRMITSYGKLDESSLQNDFNAIAKVVRSNETSKEVRNAVECCRDCALAESVNIADFIRVLDSALKILCKAQDSKEVNRIKKAYADQGMTERYRPLSRRMFREKIRKIGREVIYTDHRTDNSKTTRLVRRIVEKRAAQEVHRISGKHDRETNRYRHKLQRAVSFNLYNKNYSEYEADLRAQGTHWKVCTIKSKRKKMLVAKISYSTYEEAVEACSRYMAAHPEDPRPMSAYKCGYCGKWHIGHERGVQANSVVSAEESQDNDDRIPA